MRPAWTIASSLGLHVAGLAAAASIGTLAPSAAAPPMVPIDIVRVEPPPPAAPSPPPPKRVEKITPPRVAVRPQEVAIPTTAPAPATPLPEEPRPLPKVPELPPAAASASAPDTRLLAASSGAGEPSPTLAGAGRFGAGKGDLLLPAGDGGGNGGGTGRATGPRVASIPQETTDGTGGLTDFARPLGGYQTKPSYPESARRQGIEGIATLRFQVLTSGQVGSVSVAKSAGHTALDRAAVEAAKSWLFEPARRGKDAVSVWVTLPVRFQLRSE